jgi:hypothetical protein
MSGSFPRLSSDLSCARCGHRTSTEAWQQLPTLRTIVAADLAASVSDWPPDVVVEVRACPGCATPVARCTRAA